MACSNLRHGLFDSRLRLLKGCASRTSFSSPLLPPAISALFDSPEHGARLTTVVCMIEMSFGDVAFFRQPLVRTRSKVLSSTYRVRRVHIEHKQKTQLPGRSRQLPQRLTRKSEGDA